MIKLPGHTPRLASALTFAALFFLQVKVFASIDNMSPALQQELNGKGRIKVVAFLNPSDKPAFHKTIMNVTDVRARGTHATLVKELQQVNQTNADFVSFLQTLADSGKVSNIDKFWITDAVAFTADASVLSQISDRPELHYLVDDVPLELVEPVSTAASQAGLDGSPSAMALTGVRELWNQGYTGHGRLVCNFDTGVEGTHPALAGRWFGENGGSSSQSWFDPYGTTVPTDLNGHGTHTMGIMVGRDGADTIGVAFNAEWIAAAVVDRGQTLSRTVSDILAAFQWAADPDGNSETVDDLPDVVSNSWGIPRGLFPPCDQTFYQAIDNLEALGVVVIFACGNEGPNPGTIRNPADRTSSPTNSFSVGAVDQNQLDLPIAPFSSRGPATCDTTKVKPDIVAPGVSIRSSYRDGEYRLMSGTSMAAPFVAGCVALMREYNPQATVEQIKNALIASVQDLGTPGKDNDYGWGFINVARAIEFLPTPQKPRIAVNEIRLAGSDNGILAKGGTTALEMTVSDSVQSVFDLYAELRSSDPHIYLLIDTATFGSVITGGSLDNLGRPYLVKVDHEIAPGTTVNFSVDFYTEQQGYLNTDEFTLIIDEPTIAATTNLQNGQLSFEATNFGVGRRLVDTAAGYNLLSQLSFMIADSLGTVYDALPGNIDYLAADTLATDDFTGGRSVTARFDTRDNTFSVTQKATTYDATEDAGYVLLSYKLTKGLVTSFTRCYPALGIDIDFSDGETVTSDGDDFIFRNGAADHYVGIRMLPRGQAFGQEIAGASFKGGSLDDPAKYDLMASGITSLSGGSGDNALVVGIGPLEIPSAGNIEMAAVIASGSSLDEVRLSLQRGEAKYNQATAAGGGDINLPQSFTLRQNYPNPFNAATAISFTLPTAGDCHFEIIDILGRRVKSIDLLALPAGNQTVVWDGRDDHGNEAATGVYFYRLSFGGSSQARKMVLLK